MAGVIATALVAHVPTLGRVENTPDYQQTLVQAELTLGAALRAALEPDNWVIVSTHWVSTFDWFATCQPSHEGLCIAQEATSGLGAGVSADSAEVAPGFIIPLIFFGSSPGE